jgi:hypothetical protein
LCPPARNDKTAIPESQTLYLVFGAEIGILNGIPGVIQNIPMSPTKTRHGVFHEPAYV